MKHFIYILWSAFIFLSAIIFSCCRNSEDSIDSIRQYKPGDKDFKAWIVTLHYIIESSPTGKTDTVFSQFIKDLKLPVSAEGCKDGIYIGESPYDAYDYKHSAKVEIKDGKVISIDYNEFHKSDGHGKQEDNVYCEEMSPAGTTPAIAYPDMEKQLINKQDISKVDAISGATYSLYRFRYAVMVALMKARIASGLSKN